MARMQQWSPRILEPQKSPLQFAYDAFMVAQEAARHSPKTIDFYQKLLPRFLEFLSQRGITQPDHITPTDYRAFILELERADLSDNYVHQHAQVLKTFCRFLQAEGFSLANAFERVKMPKLDKRILPAFTPEEVKKLLGGCECNRDTALVLCLLDSGARASEFVALNLADVDLKMGQTHIRSGKGGRGRYASWAAKREKRSSNT